MSRVSPAEGPPPLQKPVASSSAVAPEDRPPLRKLAEFSKASSFGGKETEGFQFPAQFLRHCQTDVQEYYADCDNSVESMSTAAEEAAVAVAKPSMPTSNKRRVTIIPANIDEEDREGEEDDARGVEAGCCLVS